MNKLRRRAGAELGGASVTAPRFGGRAGKTHRRTPRQKETAPNYFTDYLYFLVRFDVRQFPRWEQIVNLWADGHTVAEAVEVVMLETKREGQQGRQPQQVGGRQ